MAKHVYNLMSLVFGIFDVETHIHELVIELDVMWVSPTCPVCPSSGRVDRLAAPKPLTGFTQSDPEKPPHHGGVVEHRNFDNWDGLNSGVLSFERSAVVIQPHFGTEQQH